MALDNYTDLQAAVLAWLARPGDTLISGSAPDWITLFEAEARDRMQTRFGETVTTLSTVAGTSTVALPAMYLEARELVLQSSPNQVLTYMTPQEADESYPDSAAEDQPMFYTIVGTNFRLIPTPDSAYSITCDYLQGIPALSGTPTNWLLTNYPDAYLFGTLVEAVSFIDVTQPEVEKWLARREASFERILLADRKARWSGNALQIRTDTGNP